MLMVVRNQIRVMFLSIKYALAREMLNKVTFFSNIIFMILNNASFIVQWVIIYSIKDSIGNFEFNDMLLLWGLAASGYGVSRFLFNGAFHLVEQINSGSLDIYLVQPKNVLLSVISSNIKISAIGDFIFGYIILFITGFSLSKFLLFTLFTILGAIIITCISIIFSSLSFYFSKTDIIVETINSMLINFATYPGSIFKGFTKVLLYTLIPVGIINYLPIELIKVFDLKIFLLIVLVTIVSVILAFVLFYRGLKRYSSSSLMNVRI